MKNILFILGLPRSGTTLLQRILNASAEVATVPESWLFLPFLSLREARHHKAVYGAGAAAMAMETFLQGDESLENDLAGCLRDYLAKRYPDCSYFCEKTPRNLLYAERLRKWFPDERYIILNRNPLNVAASIFRTFERNTLVAYKFRVDLELGLKQLVQQNRAPGKALVIRYEDLVGNPGETIQSCSEFLKLKEPLDPEAQLERLPGRFGDPTGQYAYSAIENQPEMGYLRFIDSKYRRRWFLRFLEGIGKSDFELLGYDYWKNHAAIRNLRVVKPAGLRDLGYCAAGRILEFMTFRVLPRRPEEVPEFILH